MAVNQTELAVKHLRTVGEHDFRDGPSLSAADCRRRDSVTTDDRCPARWTVTGRTGRQVVDSLEQTCGHQVLSKLREASFRKTP
ncbi:unknown (plasmid) [Haloarcula marismortui ATCC 43049]|uniref:Uncharacterized protein n=1 Tax=Haloarcula marismortui (strain ATCC 43049 / DSM 3752 / JCM 8966 / VKM B-1809) TaxID=272569 RepID=Q5V7L1_HALMA|nr:unknown [Haloarcula marismortui ATCC 43049]